MNIYLILILCAAALAGLAFYITTRPDEFRVTRTTLINAPADKVFEQVNDLENGQKWSPWVEMEPDADFRFEGSKAGEGAAIHWEGRKTGKGTMTIVESRANEFVKSRLDFEKPMKSTSTAEFLLEEDGTQTKVMWSMYGPNNFIGKAMGVFMDCEKMMGEQFDKGLSNLKTLLEQ